jgi:hypothetical protein
MEGAGQLSCIQQVEESMGEWVSQDEASVHDPGQNRLKPQRNGTMHWEMTVADFFANFEKWLHVEYLDNAKWIQRQWVEMFPKICAR